MDEDICVANTIECCNRDQVLTHIHADGDWQSKRAIVMQRVSERVARGANDCVLWGITGAIDRAIHGFAGSLSDGGD